MFSETGKKNLLIIVLVSVGLVGLSYILLPGARIQAPKTFHVNWYKSNDVQTLVSNIDRQFQDKWNQEKIEHAGETSRLRLARRISLGLTGTVPSIEEIRALEKQPEDQQINWWVSRLLEDRRTSDYIAERLARAYVGVEDGPFVIFRRRRFVSWLSDQIHANVGYDEIVRSLLTDQGLWTDSPAVNFMTVTTNDETGHPDPIRLAGRTTRAFLGMRIDCLQCHDDFLGDIVLGDTNNLEGGMQTHFHELAAFFSQVENSIGGVRDVVHSEPYQYTFLGETEPADVSPSVPYGNEYLPINEELRTQLTQWMTHKKNRPFARAIVNRTWAIVCGQPLVKPIDNIPLTGPFPPGMELLVDDFVEHNFDLKRLIRIIVATEVFRMDSEATFEITSKHRKYWAVFPTTRLRPEQVAGSIIQSTSLTTIDATAHILSQLTRYGQETDFVERYGDWGEEEFVARGTTVTQRLLMMNGDMVEERLTQPFNSPRQLAGFAPDSETIVETAFLSTLLRRPNARELKHYCGKFDSLTGEERRSAVEDLFWTLINCSEFSWNY